jgi:hypothetical protein
VSMERKPITRLKPRERLRTVGRIKKFSVTKIGKRPRGRPVEYREAYADLVYKLRLCGLSNVVIANIMETSEAMLWEWRQRVVEFDNAWHSGGALADANVAHSLYKRATGYEYEQEKVYPSTQFRDIERTTVTEHIPPDVSAAKLWLLNRQPETWKEKTTSEITGPNGQPLLPPPIVVRPVTTIAAPPLVIEGTITGGDD